MFRRNFEATFVRCENTRCGFLPPALKSMHTDNVGISGLPEFGAFVLTGTRVIGEGLVAQMVEHGTFNSGVMGSSPIQPTNTNISL